MKNYLSLSLIASLSLVSLAQAGGFSGSCTWVEHQNANQGNNCNSSGQAGDTVTILSISRTQITLNPTIKDDDGTFKGVMEVDPAHKLVHGKDGVDRLQFVVQDGSVNKSVVLVDQDLLNKNGKGKIELREGSDDGCFQFDFICGE